MPIEHQLVQSLVKPAMMDIPPPFLIMDGGYEGVPITITRASTKILMGPAGVHYIVPVNAQPHEWELGGAYIGRRYEEERTWRLLHNRDWTDAVYDTATNITAVKDATGLLGVANSASTLTATAANGVIRQSITLASAERTFSVNVKRKTGTGDIDITDNGGTNYTTLTGLSSSIWTRHQITRTQTNPDAGFRIVTSGDEIEVDFGGVEEGDEATSEVEVGATAVVRAADVPTITDLNWFNPNEGTFLNVAMVSAINVGSVRQIFHFDDGGQTDRIQLSVPASTDDVAFNTVNSGGDNGFKQLSGIVAGTSFKVMGAYAQENVNMSLNGNVQAPDTSADFPLADALTTFRIAHNNAGANYFNDTIASIPYWPDRRPDIELKAISA